MNSFRTVYDFIRAHSALVVTCRNCVLSAAGGEVGRNRRDRKALSSGSGGDDRAADLDLIDNFRRFVDARGRRVSRLGGIAVLARGYPNVNHPDERAIRRAQRKVLAGWPLSSKPS